MIVVEATSREFRVAVPRKLLYADDLEVTVETEDELIKRLNDNTHTHTHPFKALFPGLPGWAGTRKVKPIWILLKQETVSGSDISWAICKSASRSRQITMPVPHHSSFLQAGCPSCRPTNSVKALKAQTEIKGIKMEPIPFTSLFIKVIMWHSVKLQSKFKWIIKNNYGTCARAIL